MGENIARRAVLGTEEDRPQNDTLEKDVSKGVIDTCVERWKREHRAIAWVHMTIGRIVEKI